MKKLLNLENIIYLAIIGLPLYLLKLDFLGVPSNGLEAVQGVVILWWLFAEKYKKPKARELSRKYGKYILAISLIFFGLFSSMLANGNYRSGAGIIKSWFLMPLLFSIVVFNVFKAEKIKNILLALYFSASAVSFISLAYYFSSKLTYDGRLEAIFNSPNYLAMFLVPSIIIGFFYAEENWKVYGPLLTAILLVFFLTLSYAAWVSVFFAIAIVTLCLKKITKKTAIGTLLILLVFLFFQLGTKKWADLSSLEERSSFSSRVMIWKAAGKMVEDNPLWGIGPGNFQEKYLEYQKFFSPYLEWAVPHPHNLFLAFFLYAGIFGIIGFLALIYFWFKEVLGKENSKLKYIFLAIMIYFLLHGLVDTTYFKNDLAVIFWLSFLTLNLKKTRDGSSLDKPISN